MGSRTLIGCRGVDFTGRPAPVLGPPPGTLTLRWGDVALLDSESDPHVPQLEVERRVEHVLFQANALIKRGIASEGEIVKVRPVHLRREAIDGLPVKAGLPFAECRCQTAFSKGHMSHVRDLRVLRAPECDLVVLVVHRVDAESLSGCLHELEQRYQIFLAADRPLNPAETGRVGNPWTFRAVAEDVHQFHNLFLPPGPRFDCERFSVIRRQGCAEAKRQTMVGDHRSSSNVLSWVVFSYTRINLRSHLDSVNTKCTCRKLTAVKPSRWLTIAVLAFLATMCASVPHARQSRVPRLEELSLNEKVGQLFVCVARGSFMNASSPGYAALLHQVRDNHIGGFIWTISNVYETAELNRRLQAESRVPLLISADLEAGIGMRFSDTTFWPSAMAVAATGDPALAEAEGKVVALEARAIGVNHILAPVADVNVDPDNPVINTRSFGEDATEVSKYVAAFVRGVQSEHALACAKHFPGHGDTHIDSHRSLPRLEVTRERLARVELVPFRAPIHARVASIIIRHPAVPALH